MCNVRYVYLRACSFIMAYGSPHEACYCLRFCALSKCCSVRVVIGRRIYTFRGCWRLVVHTRRPRFGVERKAEAKAKTDVLDCALTLAFLFSCLLLAFVISHLFWRRADTCSGVGNCANRCLYLVLLWLGDGRARRASHSCLVSHMVRGNAARFCFFAVVAFSGCVEVVSV